VGEGVLKEEKQTRGRGEEGGRKKEMSETVAGKGHQQYEESAGGGRVAERRGRGGAGEHKGSK